MPYIRDPSITRLPAGLKHHCMVVRVLVVVVGWVEVGEGGGGSQGKRKVALMERYCT